MMTMNDIEVFNAHEAAIKELGRFTDFRFSNLIKRIEELESKTEKPHNSLPDDLIDREKWFNEGKLEGLKLALEELRKCNGYYPWISYVIYHEIKKLEESE
jgi:hypothetical protein